MTHTDLQHAIPEYLDGKLADALRQTVEQHLLECDECADLVESWQAFVPELRKSGGAIFEPHPAPARLRRLAQGARTEDRDASAHIAGCPSCALEVQAWGAAAVGEFGRSAPGRPAGIARSRAWWGIAATLAAAALLVAAWRGSAVAPPPEAASAWSGAPRMLVLDGVERGGAKQPRLELEDGQPYAVLGAQPVLPDSIAGDQSVRFSLADSAGREVWGVELRSDEIRLRLRSEGAMILLVPRSVLPAGPASLRAVANGERFWEVSFESAPQRQSPDATKAPQ